MINLAVTIKQTVLMGINYINNLREIFVTILKVERAQTVNPEPTQDISSQHRCICRKIAKRCPPAPKMPSGH